MPRVDFYIPQNDTNIAHFICRLATKIWHTLGGVYIHTETETQADEFDRLLWTFSDISFVPHEKISTDSSFAPVIIGWHSTPPKTPKAMINTHPEVPTFVAEFERIAEIVEDVKDKKRQAKLHYKHYCSLGFELYNHKI